MPPYVSMKQSRYMHSKMPKLAKKWDEEGGTDWKELEEEYGDKKKKKKGLAKKYGK